jgi:TonB family protein
MSYRRPRAESLSAAALVVALLISPLQLFAVDSLEQHLRDQYKGRTLVLRDIVVSARLDYDANGILANTAKPGDWTVYGVVQVKGIKVDRNRIVIDAKRILFNPTGSGFQMESNGNIRIAVNQGARTSFDNADALISRIFLTDHDDFAETLPDYWKPCVLFGLATNTPLKYKGCKFSREFLKVPGVRSRTEDTANPDDLPAAISKSVSYEVFRTGKGITPPKHISGSQPDFSDEARLARYSGRTILGVVIDQAGNAQNVWIISPSGYGLTQRAIEAISAWKFQPATKDGKPVAIQVEIVTDFNVHN